MRRFIEDPTDLCIKLGIAFSPEQLAAITADWHRPGVIVAGAGSGKTTVMAARAVWLVGHEGVPPGRILGLTFTKKAAAELGHRVRRDLMAMGDAADVLDLLDEHGEPTVSTYNAFAGSLIAEHGLRLGIETDLSVTSDATRFQRASRVIRRFRQPLPHLTGKLPSTIEKVLALDGALSEHLVSPERLREHDHGVAAAVDALPQATKPLLRAKEVALERVDLSRLVEAYRDDKLRVGVMDFSDQMSGGARLGIEVPEVGELMRERFGVVMLDEYQDTSVAQRLMLQGLFGGGHPLTAVGDPAQAIYGWRGASADNIERFATHFPAADGAPTTVLGLRTSRRCHPDVLAVANAAARPYYDAHPELAPLVPPPGEPGVDADISARRFDTVTDELAAVIDDVVAAREADPDESIAVLLRTRGEMPAITAALRERGIDAEVVGLAGLLALPHVNDVVSLLDVVADPTANPSALRLLTGDRWRVGPRDLALLGQRARHLAQGAEAQTDDTVDARLAEAVTGSDPTEIVSLADAVADPGPGAYSPEARERLADLAAVVRSVRRGLGSSIADVIALAVRRLDLDVETHLLGTGAADDLAVLIERADVVSGRADVDSLPGFLAYLRAEDEFGTGLEVPERARPGAVQVLTVHTAKGLEWDRVFVPFVVQGTFPSGQGRDRWTSNAKGFPHPLRGDADLLPRLAAWTGPALTALGQEFAADSASEEVRLAYVAFTRARRALHVSGHHWGRTQQKPRELSPFLEAAREVTVAQGRPSGTWVEQTAHESNPELDVAPVTWPRTPAPMPRRAGAAALVRDAVAGRLQIPAAGGDVGEADQLERLEELATELRVLRDEAERAAGPRDVELPLSLSASALLGLAEDEQRFAEQLARPVPRAPSPAARLGTAFHAWVEAYFGQQPLLDPTDLPGRGDTELASDADLREVIERFRNGPYADAVPHAIEAPFSMLLGEHQVVGRIDAVFATGTPDDPTYEVVDWKTSRATSADPLQLAVYRLAWAEAHGVDPGRVSAAFYYVRLGEVVRYAPHELAGRAELERLTTLGG